MGNSGSSGGGGSRKARSLPNSPEAHRYPNILQVELIGMSRTLEIKAKENYNI